MHNPKTIIYSAIIGFVFSFVFGLFGSVTFVALIIRAIASSFIFSVVVTGSFFLLNKFQMFNAVEKTDENHKPTSSKLNFSFEEESLPDSTNAPDFNVDYITNSSPSANIDPVESASSFVFNKDSFEKTPLKKDVDNTIFTTPPAHKSNIPTEKHFPASATINQNIDKSVPSNPSVYSKDIVAEKITTGKKKNDFAYANDTESITKAIQSKLAEGN
ncbi:MAG: hypothetical protein ACRC5H_04990 [Treponemataceae bacterium]